MIKTVLFWISVLYITLHINCHEEVIDKTNTKKDNKKLKLYGLNEKIYDYFSTSNNNQTQIQYLHYFSNPQLNINIKIENDTLQIVYIQYHKINQENNNTNINEIKNSKHEKNITKEEKRIKEKHLNIKTNVEENKNVINQNIIKEINNEKNKMEENKNPMKTATKYRNHNNNSHTLIYHAQVPDKIMLNEKICNINILEKNNEKGEDCNVKIIFDNTIQISKDQDGDIHVKVIPENEELLIRSTGTSLQLISKISNNKRKKENNNDAPSDGLLIDTLFWKNEIQLENQISKEIQKFEIPDLFFIPTTIKNSKEKMNISMNRLYKGGFIFI